MATLAALVKRRTNNGFWSRENEMVKKKKNSNKFNFCCFFGVNDEESVDSTTYSNLELKQCHLNKDINCLLFNSNTSDRLIVDEYANSFFGTIDRLIVKNGNISGVTSSGSSSTSASSSATSPSNEINLSQSTFFSSSNASTSLAKTSKTDLGSSSYIVNQQDDSFDKSEIHF